MRRILTGLFIAGLLGACASTPDEQEGAKVEDRVPSAKPPAKPAEPSTATKPLGTGKVAADPLKDPANILSKRSIYFDYDSNAVKDEFRPVISAHAKYLSQNRSKRVRIEGNTDERGSQIETLSFGEEKPKASGQDEAAWAENRRADIRYQGE
jgi:peptidoglycan-associated lipoprotein